VSVPHDDAMALFFGMFFGAIGTAYMLYGKRQHSATYAVSGLLLIVYTYFFDSAWAIIPIGVVLIAAPIAVDRGLI
jgi:hypothetical protein